MSEGDPEEYIDDVNDKSYSPPSSDKDSESDDGGLGKNCTGARRSKLWDHFDKAGDSVVCRHCMISLSHIEDSISNMQQHLRRKHPITEALMSSRDVTDKMQGPKMKTEDLEEVGAESKAEVMENGENHRSRKSGRSVWWKYFRPVSEETSVCLTCRKVLRHATSISNLGKHIQRKHLRNNETLVSHSDSEVQEDFDDVDHLRHSDDNECVNGDMDVLDNTNDSTHLEKDRKRRASVPHEVMLEENILDDDLLNKEVLFNPLKSKKIKLNSDVEQWEASLNTFGSYVASLMKMLPRETAARFQVQIINRLLKERFTT